MKSHNANVPLTSCRVLSSWICDAGISYDEDDNVEAFETWLGRANGSAALVTLPLIDDLSDVEPVLFASCFSTLK